MAARNRRPRRQRPLLRARFVEAPVSSMKTSFVGSRSSCPANHSRRRFWTSARCCSSACAVFFKGDLVTVEETPQHGDRKALAAIGDQPLLYLEQRDVRAAPDPERRSPPDGAGEISPVVLNRFTQRTALATLTLK